VLYEVPIVLLLCLTEENLGMCYAKVCLYMYGVRPDDFRKGSIKKTVVDRDMFIS
jgi:hypothetical protein